MNHKKLRVLILLSLLFSGLVYAQIADAQTVDNAGAYYQMLRQNQVSGQVDALDVQQAREAVYATSRTKEALGLGLEWSSIGPDNYAGRVRAIIVDKNNPSTLYAGSAGGGVWKSTTGGSSWVPMTVDGTSASAITVSCMAQAPNGHIFAGTGESWYDNGGSFGPGGFIGSGLYKSNDGIDFSVIVGTESWQHINEVVVDQNSGRIYVATDAGLMFSDDEQNWTLAKDDSGNELDGDAEDVCVGSNGIVVASVDHKAYISESGATDGFVNHSTGATGKLPATNVTRMEFDIAPSNPDYIYAMAADVAGHLQGVYRSTDKGQTWSLIGPGASSSFGVFSYQTAAGLRYIGRINNTIKVLPNMPDVVLVAGANIWQGNKVAADGFFAWTQVTSYAFDPLSPLGVLYVHQGQNDIAFLPNSSTEFYVANDGGISKATSNVGFQVKNKNLKTTQFFSVSYDPHGNVMAGSKDNGTLVIDGSGNSPEAAYQLYGGDGAQSAISMINPKAHFVTQPNAFIRRTVDGGDSWRPVLDRTLSGAYITPFKLWESFYDYTSLDSVKYEADTNYAAGDKIILRSHNNHYPFSYELPFAIAKGDTLHIQDPVVAKMFFGAVGEILMTKDILDFNNDPIWGKIADVDGTTQAMAVSGDGDVLFAGTQEGTLYRVSNINTYTTDSTPNNIVLDTLFEWPGRVITSISVHPTNANYVLVTLGNYGNAAYVYGTDEGLQPNPSFDSFQGNLPAMPVYSSLIELNSNDRLMVGTEMGVWSSNAAGPNPTWVHETNGLPDVAIFDLKQQTLNQLGFSIPIVSGFDTTYEVFPEITNYGVIYAASHGRGLFKCENFVSRNEKPAQNASFKPSLHIYPNPANDQVTLEFASLKAGQCHIQVLDLQGRVVSSDNMVVDGAGIQQISLSIQHLNPGTYLIHLILDGKSSGVNKLIVR